MVNCHPDLVRLPSPFPNVGLPPIGQLTENGMFVHMELILRCELARTVPLLESFPGTSLISSSLVPLPFILPLVVCTSVCPLRPKIVLPLRSFLATVYG